MVKNVDLFSRYEEFVIRMSFTLNFHARERILKGLRLDQEHALYLGNVEDHYRQICLEVLGLLLLFALFDLPSVIPFKNLGSLLMNVIKVDNISSEMEFVKETMLLT